MSSINEARSPLSEGSYYYLVDGESISKGRLVSLEDRAQAELCMHPSGELVTSTVHLADLYEPEVLLAMSGVQAKSDQVEHAVDEMLNDTVLSSGLLVAMRNESQLRREELAADAQSLGRWAYNCFFI